MGRRYARKLVNLGDKHRYIIKRKEGKVIEEEDYIDLFKQYKRNTLV